MKKYFVKITCTFDDGKHEEYLVIKEGYYKPFSKLNDYVKQGWPQRRYAENFIKNYCNYKNQKCEVLEVEV